MKMPVWDAKLRRDIIRLRWATAVLSVFTAAMIAACAVTGFWWHALFNAVFLGMNLTTFAFNMLNYDLNPEPVETYYGKHL